MYCIVLGKQSPKGQALHLEGFVGEKIKNVRLGVNTWI